MTTVRQSAVLIGGGITLFATSAGLTSLLLNTPWGRRLLPGFAASPLPPKVCRTIATDPKPPLFVRSSPVQSADNIVGQLPNGTILTIVDQNSHWVRIGAPVDGWVHKSLTVTSCMTPAMLPSLPAEVAASLTASHASAAGNQVNLLAEATEQYHAGQLNTAIALAKAVPPSSSAYPLATTTTLRWQRDWQVAETEFGSAQTALRHGRWQDVLNKVAHFPANRYWRARLTPLVKEAMKQKARQS